MTGVPPSGSGLSPSVEPVPVSPPDGASIPNAVRESMNVWVVWNKNGRAPRFFHKEQDGAEAEAARLALKVPGRKFIVLQMVSKFSIASKPTGGGQ